MNMHEYDNNNKLKLNNETPYEDDDPFTEMALLIKIDKKFTKVENWVNIKTKELRNELETLVDDIKIENK